MSLVQFGVSVYSPTKRLLTPVTNIRVGDVLLKLAGSETNSLAELRSLIESQGVGATVPVLIGRNGEQFTVQVKLSEVPNE